MMQWAKTTTILLLIAANCAVGCTRAKYFRQADTEAKNLVTEKACELDRPMPDFDVDPDPRSRYHDIFSQVRPPMPRDDEASHRYMQRVDGRRGYKHWYRDGTRDFLDNPNWQAQLASYCKFNDEGAVVLSLPSSISLARVHSPDIQRQIETVYLSALDVGAERFEFDVQFFAGNDTTFTHLGRLRNPALGERNALSTNNDALIRRRFTSAGELLVGFANTFVWQFAGTDTNQAFSLFNFTMVQPLLRGAYRNVAMEDLTQSERTLLANLRGLERYHQGFLTNLAIGELGVLGLLRTPGDPNSFSGNVDAAIRLETLVNQAGSTSVLAPNRALTTGFVTATGARLQGYFGLLQQYQEIRNTRQNLSAQERAIRLLEAHLAAGNIELIRVDEFRQTIEVERNNLLDSETRLQTALDEYKVNKIGLPPDLDVAIDPTLIEPVNLNSETTLKIQSQSQTLQNDIRHFVSNGSELNVASWTDELRQTVTLAIEHVAALKQESDRSSSRSVEELPAPIESEERTETDELAPPLTQPIDSVVPMTPSAFLDRIDQRLRELLEDIEGLSASEMPWDESKSVMARLAQQLTETSDLIYLTEVRVRLANVQLPAPGMTSDEAFGIASLNRLDWMNARASVVDQWRQINLQANRLKSDMDIFVSGDVGTVGNNPVKFRGPTGTMRLGVRFDGALTRLIERNAFRESIIEYQRSRRDLIRFQDTIGKNLRRVLREMDQLNRSFEIQRRAVEIAARRVDVSLQTLNRPPVPAPAGAPNNQLSPNASFSMLTALGDLRASKDNVLNVWINYQAARLLLVRDLGVMGMDSYCVMLYQPPSVELSGRVYEAPAVQTQLNLVKLRRNLEATRERLQLATSLESLASACDITNPRDTQLLILKGTADTATQSSAIANTLAEVFIENQRRVRNGELSDALTYLEGRKRDLSEKLQRVQAQSQVTAIKEPEDIEREIRSYQTKMDALDVIYEKALSERKSLQIQNDRIAAIMDEVKEKIAAEQDEAAAVEGLSNLNIRVERIREAIMDSRAEDTNEITLTQWKNRLDYDKQLLDQGYLSKAVYDHELAQFEKLRAQAVDSDQIKAWKKELEELYAKIRPSNKKDAASAPILRDLMLRAFNLELSYKGNDELITKTKESRDAIAEQRDQLLASRNVAGAEQWQVQSWRDELSDMDRSIAMVQSLQNSGVADFQIVSPAVASPLPSKSSRRLLAIGAATMLGMLATALILATELIRTNVRTRDEVALALSEPVLAAIARSGDGSD